MPFNSNHKNKDEKDSQIVDLETNLLFLGVLKTYMKAKENQKKGSSKYEALNINWVKGKIKKG